MAIRYKALTELYQETQRSVTAPDQWRAFLASACRNYRLSFYEQLLVYAQRPDATAVLEIERWNRQFGRWVNRGANGIAVFDGEHNGNADLVHYRIERYLDGQFLERRQYESLDELIQNELAELDFDQLTSVDQDYFNGKYPPDIEPYIFCEWSESPVFEDGKRYGIREFDTLMKQADEEQVAGAKAALEKYGTWQAWYESDDPENARFLGYDKVKFTVVMPDGTTYTERQDIGDGDGGVLDFLAQYPKYQDILPLLQQSTPPQNDYMLLSRLKADCDYFLGAGGRAEKHLWAGNVREQIAKMRELYDALPEKPEWLTMEDIDRYAQRMEPPYEVVVYHHFENGFDERLDYQTLAEAEQAAQKYVAGTMEGEDGFAYDGAGIYDLQENRWLRVYGNFPDERAIEQAKQAPAAEEQPASPEQADLQPKKEEALPLPPKHPRRERITFTTLHPEVPRDQHHDFHITDDALGHGTPSEKYAANAAAIRTLKQIEAEERLATPEEQEILSRYVGWGGLANCFEQTSPHYEELKSLLDSEEYAAARASSLTSFYTPPVVIRGIYKALAQMGFTQADMFSKRTIRPHVAVTSVDTASEALAVSISEKARVDIEYMAELSGKSPEELERELAGVIYRDIRCAENPEDILPSLADLDRYPFVTADEYLSGKVRHKLRMAKAFLEVAPDNQKETARRNVEALEAVQPQDLGAGEIGVRIGANWVPIEVYQQFMVELLTPNYYVRDRIKILRSEATGQWSIREKNADRSNVKANTTYGTKRMSAYHILEQTLNQRDVRVFDYIEDENGKKKPVLNKKETAIAQDRQELIKQKFAEWIWKNIDRRELLCRIYNETFNGVRPREYDGRHIRFEGMNPEISLRPHQINAIAHILYGGNTLLAHEVGAGKTYEMVAAAMEMKRLGLCTKSLIVVPNHITEQWAAEWLQLYPSANILVATKKDFETQNRKKFCSRIATGDYDAIIIGHSQFEKIPMSVERQQAILERQIEEILEGIEQAKAQKAERYTVKQMERTRKSLETRLAKLNDQSRKDDVVTFEQLGIDRLFIDESHYFKNLFLATKMRNVGGIAQTEAQKSSDLFMKTQYLDELTGGRGTIFATGTPISNSMVELYTIQRYLQYRLLQEMGLIHFDDWASNFGETVTAIELSPEGTGYRAKTRFAKFYNLPELMAAFKEVADIQTADMLKLPVPKANFHTEVIQPSELQKEMIKGLAERAEKIRGGGVDPHVDNMLRITNDGRKLALDMRLIQPLAPDAPNGKVAVCARNVFRIWEQTKEKRSAQLVFCDLSTPTTDGSFSVYDDLKKKLMDAGIPEEEIAFIHTADSEAKKKELFSKVRAGQVRVLLGSTAKMGAGTNVQDRLIALHDLDCPWRPSDLQQRLGRIVRQGNENEEVEIYRYVTEGTFDAYLYQLVENKQKFIAQIMTSKAPVRVADDVDETALSYSEIKALATGNPLIIEKCNLDMEVARLNMLKASHLNQVYALEELAYRKYPEEITRLTERIEGYEQDVALVADHPKTQEGFCGMEVDGKHYTEKEDAGKAIIDVCTRMTGSDAVLLGQYRGFSMVLAYDGMSNEYRITLKGTLSHTVTLGADVFGNITRLDNALENLPKALESEQAKLAETNAQLENARTELAAPFSREEELAEKTKRLKELNILLNMDEKDKTLMDDGPDEGEEVPARKSAELAR